VQAVVTEPATLKRSLSLPLITFYGLGTILGAGIYVLLGKVVGSAGLHAPLAFLLASCLALFTAFSYAELSARLPFSAGEAVYVQHALGRRSLSVLVGLLVVLVGVVSPAVIAKGFVGYLHVFVDVPGWLATALLVLALGTLAAWGISQSVVAASVITVVEIGGLVLVLWVARDSFGALPSRVGELVPAADTSVWHGVLLGAFLAFYAFIGFEDMVNVAEEVERPQRNLPLAIFIALAVTTVLYMAVALVAVLALPTAQLAASEAPLALIYERSTGRPPTLISLVSMLAVINGALIQIIMASRVLYGMGVRGWVPRPLGRVHPLTRTPLVATVLITAVVLVLALALPLVTLAKVTSLITLVVFALVNLSLWRIKGTDPHPPGVKTFPRWLPATGFVASAGFVVYQGLSFVWRTGLAH